MENYGAGEEELLVLVRSDQLQGFLHIPFLLLLMTFFSFLFFLKWCTIEFPLHTFVVSLSCLKFHFANS